MVFLAVCLPGKFHERRAVAYVNGAEVFRSNMPTGAVNYVTVTNGERFFRWQTR